MIKTIKTDLICSECGNIFPISRKANKQKKELHIKDLYCPSCKKQTKHFEMKNGDIYIKKISGKEESDRNEEEKMILRLIKKK